MNDSKNNDQDIKKNSDDFVKHSLISSAELFCQEGREPHEYDYAERSILVCILCLKNKRRERNE